MSTIEHVRSFLAPVPLTDDVGRFALARAEAAAADPRIASLQAELRERILGIGFRSETIRLYERLAEHGVACEISGLPSFSAILLAAAFSRGKEGIRLQPIGTDSKTIASLAEQSITTFDNLMSKEPDFFDEMLMEVSVRATRDPAYTKQLQDDAAELETILAKLPPVSAPSGKEYRTGLGDGWVALGTLMGTQTRQTPSSILPAAPSWAHKALDIIWDVCVWLWGKLK